MDNAKNQTPVVEVESYYDAVHQGSWARRTAGFMGGTTLGAAFGGMIGAVTAFLPLAFGVSAIVPTLAAVAGSAAVFAGIGGMMGFGAVGAVGEQSGAVAAGFEEKEKREKLGLSGATQAVTKEIPLKRPASLFNWKVAAVTVPLFAAFGALLALSPMAAPALAAIGFQGAAGVVGAAAAQSVSAAAIAAAATVMGMFGALIGVDCTYLTNKVSDVYMKLITGECFEKHHPEPAPQPAKSPEMPVFDAPDCSTKSFAANERKFSLANILNRSEEPTNALSR